MIDNNCQTTMKKGKSQQFDSYKAQIKINEPEFFDPMQMKMRPFDL